MIDPRQVIEGWAVETYGGLIFTVKGVVHPPDRVIAYLRYLPDASGERRAGHGPLQGNTYRRVYREIDQLRALAELHPEYVARDPMLGMVVQSVPWPDVVRVHDPLRRLRELRELRESGATTDIENDAVRLAELIAEAGGVGLGRLGITGSLLVGLDEPSSDLDLLVLGEAAGWAVRDALLALLAEPNGPLKRPNAAALRALHNLHRDDTPLTFAQFCRAQARKVNEGTFAGRGYFLRFVRTAQESGESYGEPSYAPGGEARVSAVVTSAAGALFTPNHYALGDVEFLEGTPVEDLREVVSHRGRFAEQAVSGEAVEAQGRLERVMPGTGSGWHRLVVGGRSGEYLVVRSGLRGTECEKV